jgi:hypothetical protein
MRTARVTWIISVIQVFKFIRFVSVIKAKGLLLRYMNTPRSVRHQVSGKDGDVCKLSVHFVGKDCTSVCRHWRSHGLRRGARRRQGCLGHPGRKLGNFVGLGVGFRVGLKVGFGVGGLRCNRVVQVVFILK